MTAARADNPLLAFIHVPKTGGTSVQAVLEGVLMNRRPVFNIRHPTQVRAFLDLPAEEQDAHYGVYGHMPFGIDRHVDRPVTYMTFLRDGVEHALSRYAHLLRYPHEPGAAEALALGVGWTARQSDITVLRLADHDLLQTPDSSGQVWIDSMPPPTHEHLEQAKANLERCAFIGLHEHYEDDVRALGDLSGHRILVPPILPKEKVGDNRLRVESLSEEQVEAIRSGNRFDAELYAHALALRRAWGGPVRPDSRRGERWSPLQPQFQRRYRAGDEQTTSLPATFATPPIAYGYGALSDVLPLERATTIRVTARARHGSVAVCLVTADDSAVASEQRWLTVGGGEETLFLTYDGAAPVRLCVRTFETPGLDGEAEVLALHALS